MHLVILKLSESGETFNHVLTCWQKPFDKELSKVIFTEWDESIYMAIISVPSSNEIKHFCCVFHFFDLNIKKWIPSTFSLHGGSMVWTEIKNPFEFCQEAAHENQLVGLWFSNLERCFQLGKSNANVRREYVIKNFKRREENRQNIMLTSLSF